MLLELVPLFASILNESIIKPKSLSQVALVYVKLKRI